MTGQRARFSGQFIWNTYGDWCATLIDGHIWDQGGNWAGWIEPGGDVYKADGEWIGTLSKDGRILKKRAALRRELRADLPAIPPRPELPAHAPLPPQFSELSYSDVDVLDEDPDIFKRLSERRPDMD